ncbi:MurR/RpiR family transcriptional regulator [Burkholderia plantarii]|uniref:MurR/RpiR family transcriptional regulator n=1 Tax=Burkholderia plantarii TaxID=41899 RepID=UPI0018DEAFC9|nr:MurR/RpiR family transcriptional regulator [Burkholderia plantarii]MBI0328967.1 MurR/RpiR family transcriptional regulator [Burkholderia plantarii]
MPSSRPDAAGSPPDSGRQTPEALLADISAQFASLSKQLKLIARHVEAHPGRVGLQGVQEVANDCGVQPSAVVRFAKHFGFSGFSGMQRVFRDAMVRQVAPELSYQSRIRGIIEQGEPRRASELAAEFLDDSIAGMQQLSASLDAPAFEHAVDLLAATDAIWLVGMRRSYPVVAYLDYALQHTGKRIQLVAGTGGMQAGQLRSLRAGDVVLAVSFAPYAQETQQIVEDGLQRGATLIAITDSRLNALASRADAALLLQESDTFGFRSLTSTMGLAQSLFIALAYRLELAYEPAPDHAKS